MSRDEEYDYLFKGSWKVISFILESIHFFLLCLIKHFCFDVYHLVQLS